MAASEDHTPDELLAPPPPGPPRPKPDPDMSYRQRDELAVVMFFKSRAAYLRQLYGRYEPPPD